MLVLIHSSVPVCGQHPRGGRWRVPANSGQSVLRPGRVFALPPPALAGGRPYPLQLRLQRRGQPQAVPPLRSVPGGRGRDHRSARGPGGDQPPGPGGRGVGSDGSSETTVRGCA